MSRRDPTAPFRQRIATGAGELPSNEIKRKPESLRNSSAPLRVTAHPVLIRRRVRRPRSPCRDDSVSVCCAEIASSTRAMRPHHRAACTPPSSASRRVC